MSKYKRCGFPPLDRAVFQAGLQVPRALDHPEVTHKSPSASGGTLVRKQLPAPSGELEDNNPNVRSSKNMIKNLSLITSLIVASSTLAIGCSESKPKFNASNAGGEHSSGVSATPVPQPPPLVLPVTASPAVPGPAASGSAAAGDPPDKASEELKPDEAAASAFCAGQPSEISDRWVLVSPALDATKEVVASLCTGEFTIMENSVLFDFGTLKVPEGEQETQHVGTGVADVSKNPAPGGALTDRWSRLPRIFPGKHLAVAKSADGKVTRRLHDPLVVYLGPSGPEFVVGVCKSGAKYKSDVWASAMKKKCSSGDYGGAIRLDKAYDKWATREDLQSEVAARKAVEAELAELKKKKAEPPPVGYNPSAP